MNRRPGQVRVTTEVAMCSFCGRPRTLRREEHQLGTLVRTIVTCETCHRTLSSTMGMAAPTPEPVAAVAEPEPVEATPKPKRAPAKPAAAKKSAPAKKPAPAKKTAPAAKKSRAAAKPPARRGTTEK